MEIFLKFVLILIIGILWLYLFKKIRILDNPWPDVPKRDRVPTHQWIFLLIIFLILILIFYPNYIIRPEIYWFLIWSIILASIWLVDSFFKINPKIRLFLQFICIWIVFFVWWVWFDEIVLPWWFIYEFDILSWFILTLIWFVLFINSVNWFDWVYWLASWVSTIWFLTIFLLIKFVVLPTYPSISSENLEILNIVQNLSLILFMIWTVYTYIEYKPYWLIRDVWTFFLWFCLAYLSLFWWAKIWSLLVVLSLVIFDSIYVVFNRIFVLKKSPLKWDYTHLHHRLLANWWSRNEIRFFIWIWAIFLMILIILQWANSFNKIIIFILMFIIFFWVNTYLFLIKKLPSEFKKNKIQKDI